MGCGEPARENLRKLAGSDATVVITGQQAGILTGPLYTIYKTITVIQLAERAAHILGKPVVPVFWVAAEDHDYAEIDHLDFVNKEQKVMRLNLAYKPEGKFSVGHLPVTAAVHRLIEELESNTNPSEWKPEITAKLMELAENCDNLADWFAAVMAWLFRDYGVILINPLNLQLRRMWSATFKEFLQKTELINTGLQAGMNKVRALGIEPQVATAGNNAHLFYYIEGERLPLLRQGEKFSVRGRNELFALEELTEIAEANPELLSPNVVLRPVAQDVLLPILAYVAGPGEISYYALYREIYPLFGQSMPIIYPRVNITIVERGIAKHMDKYGVKFTEGVAGLHQKINELLDNEDKIGIDRVFLSYTDELKKSFSELIREVAVIDPELTKHGHENLNKMLHQLEHFAKKARQSHRKSCELIINRFGNIENQLFPHNNWQERLYNIFPYLFKYGTTLINELTETPFLGNNLHKLVYPGEKSRG
jgi:bacillithiol biosynthesis cysteine-adding enzyme BshC